MSIEYTVPGTRTLLNILSPELPELPGTPQIEGLRAFAHSLSNDGLDARGIVFAILLIFRLFTNNFRIVLCNYVLELIC